MAPKGGSTKLQPLRLPPLPRLRLRRPTPASENPCMALMSSMLACWAASANNPGNCVDIEQQLRACMDEKRPKTTTRNTINYHMMRLYPKIKMPSKRKK